MKADEKRIASFQSQNMEGTRRYSHVNPRLEKYKSGSITKEEENKSILKISIFVWKFTNVGFFSGDVCLTRGL